MFLKSLIGRAAAEGRYSSTPHDRLQKSRLCVKGHAGMYALLPTVLQATFEKDAADHRGARMQDIDQQQRLLRADVNNLAEGLRAERATQGYELMSPW